MVSPRERIEADIWTQADQEALVQEVAKTCATFAPEYAAYKAMPQRHWADPLWSQAEVDARISRINEAISKVRETATPLRALGDKVERLFKHGGAKRSSLYSPVP